MKKLATLCSITALGCSMDYSTDMQYPDNHIEVINGMKGDYKNYKSIVAISTSSKSMSCTGNLIKPDLVLTAAHCLPFAYKVVYGVNNVAEDEGIVRKVLIKETNPNYFPKGEEHYDIGMVLLDQKFDEAVPIEILPPEMYEKNLQKGQKLTIAGYGKNSDSTSGILNYGTNYVVERSKFKMLVDGESGLCHGDSGGPTYVQVNDQQYLTGVTSRLSSKEGKCGDLTVVELPGSYLFWIETEYLAMKEEASKLPVPLDHGAEIKGVRETSEEGCNISGKNDGHWLLILLAGLRRRKD